jgi:hypothetical protein
MLKLLEVLLEKDADQSCIYFSWDAASWHASKKLYKRVEEINSAEYQASHKGPLVKLAPLPSCAQFLNVIESVFSGMARAIIHSSDYQSVDECKAAIGRPDSPARPPRRHHPPGHRPTDRFPGRPWRRLPRHPCACAPPRAWAPCSPSIKWRSNWGSKKPWA